MALSQQTTYRLIGGGDARGLSGDARRVLPADPALDFYDACLRQHRATVDLVVDPDQVWDVETPGARPQGLHAHLKSASRERLVSLTDVLVVVSDDDWERAQQNHGARWTRHLAGALRASFEDWCTRGGIPRRNPHRPLGVRVVVDGSNDTFGQRLGLGPGEFITGLLPNLYSGPAVASRALISVMVNLPGEWEGYREVVRLYDDQDLLTLGNHWLDNFSHPALAAPALYRLQFHPDDGLVHLTSPDVAGEFSLTRHDGADGSSVYGIASGDGQVVAWLVLAVVEAPAPPAPTPVQVESFPTVDGRFEGDSAAPDDPTVADRPAPAAHATLPLESEPPVDDGYGSNEPAASTMAIPLVGPPASPGSVDGTPEPSLSDRDTLADRSLSDRDTLADPPARSEAPVVPPPPAVPPPPELPAGPQPEAKEVPARPATVEAAGIGGGLVAVREAGVLLQRVHFRDFMVGYEVYISATGDIGSDLPNPAATVQVVGRRVRLFAHVRGVKVSGVGVPVNAAAVLGTSTQIDVNGVVLDYHDLSAVRLKGWPYLGEIRRRGSNIHLPSGAVHKVGRDSACPVRLPDDSHHGNIIWRPEVDAGAVIRSRNGDIPKSRFTLDSIMVASQHAELDLSVQPPRIRNTAGSCFSFVRRGREGARSWIGLSRVQRPIGGHDTHLEAGDELYIGNCILRIDWAEGEQGTKPVEVPPPVAFSLADEPPVVPEDLPLPPPPLLPVPPVPDLPADFGPMAPPPLPASHRGPADTSPSSSATWVESASLEAPGSLADAAGLPGDSPPPPVVGPPALESELTNTPSGVPDLSFEPDQPPVEESVDDAWSPFGTYEDDPTELPVPRFLQKKGGGS